jgi:PPM family protein phosphatase
LSSVRVQCPHCRAVCQVLPEQLGSAVKCAKCGQPFGLPAAPGAPAVPAASAAPAAKLAAPPTPNAVSAPAQAPAAAPPAPASPPAAAAPVPAAARPQSPPPAPATSAPAGGAAVTQETVVQEVDASLGSGIWKGLRSLYRAVVGPASAPAAGAAPAASPPPPAPPAPPAQPPSEEEIGVELDGPAAAALAGGQAGLQAPPSPGTCRLDVGSATSCGRVRTRNEDSHLVVQVTSANLDQRRDVVLVVVADGMGGYDAGDKAAGLTIRAAGGPLLGQLIPALAVQGQEKPAPTLAENMRTVMKLANKLVHEKAQTDPACKGMGATAVAVLVWEGQVLISHVGDTRVYHHSAGRVRQVTRDQTLVARMVEMGKLTPEEALTHPNRNEVTQAIGRSADIQPAGYELQVAPGDWLIVACDGLHAHVEEPLLAGTLHNAPPSAAAMADRLVELANQGGGSDNCTVVAIRCY